MGLFIDPTANDPLVHEYTKEENIISVHFKELHRSSYLRKGHK